MDGQLRREITPPPLPPEALIDVHELDENDFVLESEGTVGVDVPKKMVDFAKGEVYDFRVQGRDGIIKAAEAIGVAPDIEVFEELEELNMEAAEAIEELEAELVEEQTSETFSEIELKVYEALLGKGLAVQIAEKLIEESRKKVTDQKFLEDVVQLCKEYGFEYDSLSSDNKDALNIFYVGAQNKEFSDKRGNFLEKNLKEMLALQAIKKVDSLTGQIILEEGKELSEDEVREKVNAILESLHAVSKKLPAEQSENTHVWDILLDRFQKLVNKKGRGGEKFQKVFREVFSEFSDFIEDDILAQESERRFKKGEKVISEQLMMELYGRTRKELEEIKVQNRVNVVEEILRLKDESTVTLEMLERLHEINNRGIVPKNVSRLRSPDDTRLITFGKRIGIIGLDVKTEMDAVADRTNQLVERKTIKKYYEIAAAQLHNQLLDIHPFADRNGSTALLFLELLMSKRGYKPSPERQSNYYLHLQKILGSNPVAVGIVAYQHYKIRFQEGYYEGDTTKIPEMQAIYNESLQIHLKGRQESIDKAKAAKRDKKLKEKK